MQYDGSRYFAFGANDTQTSAPPTSGSGPSDQQQLQPLTLATGLPVYPPQPGMQILAPGGLETQPRKKRKQVKNACVNCQKACKKCDDGRPCQRCIKYNLESTCVNSVRKPRVKGIKRGPYKKRKQGDAASSAAATGSHTAVVGGSTSLNTSAAQTTSDGQHNGVLSFPQFPQGAYDPFRATSYPGTASILQSAFMVPVSMQQMYSSNPSLLSYHAAMNILSPQQVQSTSNLFGGFKPAEGASSQQPTEQPQATSEKRTEAHPPAEGAALDTEQKPTELSTAGKPDANPKPSCDQPPSPKEPQETKEPSATASAEADTNSGQQDTVSIRDGPSEASDKVDKAKQDG